MTNSHIRSWSGRKFVSLLLVELLVLQPLLGSIAFAGPEDANVVAGDVQIDSNAGTTVIHASDGSIIDYSSFDIAVDETVQFIQPGSAARVLNRIRSAMPTQIDGALLANGQVYIVNPMGVFFGDGAHIDVGRLVAAAGHISNEDFLAGNDRFRLTGAVENLGEIQAREAALIGRYVLNSGVIRGESVIVLAAGDEVFLMQPGQRGFVRVDRSVLEGADTGIVNTGTIDAGAGQVVMSAGDLYSLAIFNTGRVSARDIELVGGDGGRVTVAGELDAAGRGENGQGGSIRVLGDEVEIADADIDASGTSGGEILIGGDYQGQGNTATARRTYVSAQASIRADAESNGDGGKVIVWADEATGFVGRISARGGSESGDGGFVEVSGKEGLGFAGEVDTTAANGEIGTLLLDPKNVLIDDSGATTALADVDEFIDSQTMDLVIDRDSINTAPTTVVIQANTDIELAASSDINMTTASAGLTLQAGRSVLLNSNITTNDGEVNITANETAANGVIVAQRDADPADITMASGVTINAGNQNINLTISDGAGVGGASGDVTLGALTTTGDVAVSATGGSILDGNAAAVNITAADANLTTTGAGETVAADLAVTTLSASSDGDITLTEADDVVVDLVASTSGSVSLTAAGAIDGDAMADDGDIAAATVVLSAGAGIGLINQLELSGTTNLTLATNTDAAAAANEGFDIESSADLTDLSVTLTPDAGQAETYTLVDGGFGGGAGGTYTLTDSGADVTVETITGATATTLNSFSLTNSAGSITSDGVVDGDIAAASVTLDSAGAIGAAGAANAIELAGTSVAIEASADAGDVNLSFDGAASIGTVDATGTVTITAADSITDADDDDLTTMLANVIGSVVNLFAGTDAADAIGATGQVLEVNADTLSATAGGDIFLAEEDAVTVTTIDSDTGAASLVAAGTITLGQFDAAGLARVESTGGAIVDDNGATTNITAGSVSLEANTGIDADLATNLVVLAMGDGTIDLNVADADAIATTVTDIDAGSGTVALIVDDDITLGTVDATGLASIESTGGAITDGNAAATNVTAGSVSLTAAGGIDSDLDTNVLTLAMGDGTIDLNVADADAIATTVTDIDAGSGTVALIVDDDIALGTVDATGLASIESTGGAITDGNAAATNVTAGSVSLTAAGGIDSDLDTNVLTLAMGDGTIDLNVADADAIATTVTDIDAGSGTVTLTVDDDITLGTVDATGLASIESTGGAITDGNAAATNVTAGSVSLTAMAGIVSDLATNLLTLAMGDGAIDLNVADADAIATTVTDIDAGSGTVTLTVDDDIALGTVDGTGLASIESTGGAITDGNAAVTNITADSVSLAAAGGIDSDLDTNVLTLAMGDGTIDLNVADADAIATTVTDIDAGSGTVALIVDDDITLGTVDATGLASIESTGGAITDGNAAATNVTAGSVSLTAMAGIVSDLATNLLTLAMGDGAIDLSVADADTTATAITAIDAGTGTVTLSVDDDIALGTVDGTGLASIESTGGAITDGNAAATNITADSVSLMAAGGIESDLDTNLLTLAMGDGAIDLRVADGDATALTVTEINAGTGTVALTVDDDITLGTVDATGLASIESTGGAITDGNAAAINVTAGSASLTAAGAIDSDLDTNLLVLAMGNGTIDLNLADGDATATTVTAIDAGTGTVALTVDDDIMLGTVDAAGLASIESTAGAILDGNAAAINVTAGSVSLTAVGGIDSDLATNLLVLAMGDGTIDLSFADADAVATTVTAIDGGTGSVTLTVDDDLDLGTVDATGLASIESTGGAINDGNAAATNITAGSVSLVAADGIESDLDTNLLTLAMGDGTIDLRLADADATGAVVTAIDAGSGTVTLTVDDDLSLGTVDATGLASIESTGGAITDGNAAATNVTAGSVSLTAVGGIDSDLATNLLTLAMGDGAIDLNVADADTTATTVTTIDSGSGTVTLSVDDAIALGTIDATGLASIASTSGAITDGNGAAINVTADSISLMASGGLDTDVDTNLLVLAMANGTLDLTVTDADATSLTVTAMDAGSGTVALTSDDAIVLGTVDATGLATIESTSGAISDGNAAAINITAGSVSLMAMAGIDSDLATNLLTLAMGNGAIDLSVSDADTTATSVSAIDAGTGTVTLTVDDDVSLGTVDATGLASIESTGGAVTDGNAAATNVTADSVSLMASSGIDADLDTNLLTLAMGDGAIDLNVADADATATTVTAIDAGSGTVALTVDDDILLGAVDAAGLVNIESTGGAISDGNGATSNISAGAATLTADTDITMTLATNVTTLVADAGGDVAIDVTGTDGTGTAVTTLVAGGTADVTVDDALIASGQLMSTGAMNLTSNDRIDLTGVTLGDALAGASIGGLTLTTRSQTTAGLGAEGSAAIFSDSDLTFDLDEITSLTVAATDPSMRDAVPKISVDGMLTFQGDGVANVGDLNADVVNFDASGLAGAEVLNVNFMRQVTIDNVDFGVDLFANRVMVSNTPANISITATPPLTQASGNNDRSSVFFAVENVLQNLNASQRGILRIVEDQNSPNEGGVFLVATAGLPGALNGGRDYEFDPALIQTPGGGTIAIPPLPAEVQLASLVEEAPVATEAPIWGKDAADYIRCAIYEGEPTEVIEDAGCAAFVGDEAIGADPRLQITSLVDARDAYRALYADLDDMIDALQAAADAYVGSVDESVVSGTGFRRFVDTQGATLAARNYMKRLSDYTRSVASASAEVQEGAGELQDFRDELIIEVVPYGLSPDEFDDAIGSGPEGSLMPRRDRGYLMARDLPLRTSPIIETLVPAESGGM